jgi:MauM/NapG family ferredoxin protein
MSAPRSWWNLVRARHAVQITALLLFLGLFLSVRAQPNWTPGWAVNLFFHLDPLIQLLTGMAARALPATLGWALLVVVLTVILGRVFCGWFCPLGTVHALAGRFLNWAWPHKEKDVDTYSPWQRVKYFVLVGALVMALFGSHWICIFDPLVLLTRSMATAVFPAVQWAVEDSSTTVWQAEQRDPKDPRGPVPGYRRFSTATEPVYSYLRDHVFGVASQAFIGGWLIFAVFLVTLVLNRVRRRFWCRYLCPLGALLGLLAWKPLLRRRLAEGACTQCELCNHGCSGAAASGPGEQWRPSECFGCMSCSAACPRSGLAFTFSLPGQPGPETVPVDLSKRALLGSVVGGVVGLSLLRIAPQARGRTYNPDLVRPPGAREESEFLKRCTSCGLCMKVCTTGGLQPTLTEAGLEGLWTPQLVSRIGACDYTCNLCGQVCPTQAIQPLTIEKKKKVRIGLAVFDTTRCLPYAFGTNCTVCEEHCPIPAKAIYSVEVEVADRSGVKHKILQPHIDPAQCTGCGLCENVCPFKDLPAVRVTSANESRHEGKNQPILPNQGMVGIEGY